MSSAVSEPFTECGAQVSHLYVLAEACTYQLRMNCVPSSMSLKCHNSRHLRSCIEIALDPVCASSLEKGFLLKCSSRMLRLLNAVAGRLYRCIFRDWPLRPAAVACQVDDDRSGSSGSSDGGHGPGTTAAVWSDARSDRRGVRLSD